MSHNVSSSGNQGGLDRDRDNGSLLKKAATAVGAVFLLVGILGFIPGITSNIYPIDLMNTNKISTNQKLLGIFEISVLHNLVHVLFGVAGLLMARTWNGAKNYLIGGGVIYLVLWLYGLVVPKDSPANFVPVNSADDWLHFVLGAAMIALGVLLAKRDREANNAYAR